MAIALAVLLPIGVGAALAARIPIDVRAARNALTEGPVRPAGEPRDLSARWTELEIETLLWPDAPGGAVVELRALADPEVPDLLVYWSPPGTSGVRADSICLGSMSGVQARRFVLPAAANAADETSATASTLTGSLVLYSLAHQKPIALARLGES